MIEMKWSPLVCLQYEKGKRIFWKCYWGRSDLLSLFNKRLSADSSSLTSPSHLKAKLGINCVFVSEPGKYFDCSQSGKPLAGKWPQIEACFLSEICRWGRGTRCLGVFPWSKWPAPSRPAHPVIIRHLWSFLAPRLLLTSACRPLTNPLLQMSHKAVSTLSVSSCYVFVLTGGGGGREQEEHQNQTDAKADPTPRGGEENSSSTSLIINLILV